MSTFKDIIENRKGKTAHWRVEASKNITTSRTEFSLYHYTTEMLRWADTDDGTVCVYSSLGKGSKTDQDGMNVAFSLLNLPAYYSRKGGASIEWSGNVYR